MIKIRSEQIVSVALKHGMYYVFFKFQILNLETPKFESQAPMLCVHGTMPSLLIYVELEG